MTLNKSSETVRAFSTEAFLEKALQMMHAEVAPMTPIALGNLHLPHTYVCVCNLGIYLNCY